MVNIPLEIIELQSDGFHLLIDVELFDKSFKMVLDTGASKTVLDKTTLLNAGIEESTLVSSNILSSGLGTNNMESYFTTIPYIKIADWEVKNFSTAVLDLSTINFAYEQMNFSPVVGVLGGDILKTYGAVINYKTNTLRLNTRKSRL